MPECPFSRERLAEMRWTQHWPLSAIAAVANGVCDERVTEETVEVWCKVLGVSTTPPPKPEDVLPSKRSSSVAPGARGRPGQQSALITRTCAFCGAGVTRYASEFTGKSEIAFCNAGHQRLHALQQGVENKKMRKAAGPVPDLAVGLGICSAEKLCNGPCGRTLPIGNFSVDISRGDGRARICLDCNKAKSREYYACNRERQSARTRENKRKKRAAVKL